MKVNWDYLYHSVSLAFDIFVFGFLMHLMLFDGYEKIAEALDISLIIALVIVAWSIIGLVYMGFENLALIAKSSQRHKGDKEGKP